MSGACDHEVGLAGLDCTDSPASLEAVSAPMAASPDVGHGGRHRPLFLGEMMRLLATLAGSTALLALAACDAPPHYPDWEGDPRLEEEEERAPDPIPRDEDATREVPGPGPR